MRTDYKRAAYCFRSFSSVPPCVVSTIQQFSVFCCFCWVGAVRGPTSLTTMAHRPDLVAATSMVQVQKKKRLLYGHHARQREARPHSSSSDAARCAGPHPASHMARGKPALACTQVLLVHANSSGVHRASQSVFEMPAAATAHCPAVHL